MSNQYKVRITVKEVRGECSVHRPGDTVEIIGVKQMKGHICPTALCAIYPYVFALRYGAEFPYPLGEKDKVLVCCNDPKGVVVFELKRLEKIE